MRMSWRAARRLAVLTAGAGLGLTAALSLPIAAAAASPAAPRLTAHYGSVHDGSVHDGSVHDGSVHDGSVHDGSVHDGSVLDGAAGLDGAPGLAAGSGQAVSVRTTRRASSPSPAPADRAARLPGTGFDGILVAAVGTALTVAGWLLLIAGSRRLRR
jgi:hypothetical protein